MMTSAASTAPTVKVGLIQPLVTQGIAQCEVPIVRDLLNEILRSSIAPHQANTLPAAKFTKAPLNRTRRRKNVTLDITEEQVTGVLLMMSKNLNGMPATADLLAMGACVGGYHLIHTSVYNSYNGLTDHTYAFEGDIVTSEGRYEFKGVSTARPLRNKRKSHKYQINWTGNDGIKIEGLAFIPVETPTRVGVGYNGHYTA